MLADFFVCSTFSTPMPPQQDILCYNLHGHFISPQVLCRTSGVAYLASYLSHGKFLTTSFVDNILERSMRSQAGGLVFGILQKI
ncbi:hypothetical protein VitviT2T_005983 [Vitis vinifera]|uniref:Uncharacterized protein n=1 Tax=Vitis vinifera TaxID=29760 RepID=A0ABY9BUP0_VITVI|nr:hypothetical protein VitviT2T_005983 [Vitis vinifera]